MGRLGNVEMLPTEDEVAEFATHRRIREIFDQTADRIERRELLHHYAKEALENNKVKKAWKILLTDRLNAQKPIQTHKFTSSILFIWKLLEP